MLYHEYGGAGWTLYLICVAFAGAYAFGLAMWHLQFRAIFETRSDGGRTTEHKK
jgi:hypothetical protein